MARPYPISNHEEAGSDPDVFRLYIMVSVFFTDKGSMSLLDIMTSRLRLLAFDYLFYCLI